MQLQAQPTYTPAIVDIGMTYKYSLLRIQVATIDMPESICGFAQRVGYTGKKDTDLAIYRLKVKPKSDKQTMTLPGFFVIVQGIFTEYERWNSSSNKHREHHYNRSTARLQG